MILTQRVLDNSPKKRSGWLQLDCERQSVQCSAAAPCELGMFVCRLQAWFRPHNPGMTAAEALCAPFFTKVIDPEPENGDEAV